MITVGTRVYALGAIALGVVGLVWGDFALVWQPVPPAVPERTLLAYLFAGAMALAGLGVNWRRTAASGAAGLCVLFALVVVLLHAPRIVAHPQVFGAWSGLAEQLALLCGGLVAYALVSGARLPLRVGQLAFGCCAVIFGLAHFFYLKDTADFVPGWLRPHQTFWAEFTGVAHIAAGLAILTGLQARLAAVLLTIMFALFGALIHAPLLIGDPHSHLNWVMNSMNLALTGAAWAVADSLAARRLR
jgi:uncharacterized membrane protein YphA (DoxX/SURF4 family)